MADDETLEDAPDNESGPGENKLSKAQPWLSLLDASEKAFKDYHDKADSIDKLYANLSRLASTSREREFQLFWANIQVLGPSIYSRPPVPVVVPRFKDRRPIARTASEVLERTLIVTAETQDLNGDLLATRDDLTVIARGQLWLQLETKDGDDYVTFQHLDRRDYRCDPARNEKECDWKAKRAWMTKAEARKRFFKISGLEYQNATYIGPKKRNEGYTEGDDNSRKAAVWEIWCKSANKVVWVAEGCNTVLDEGPPHLELEGFFPCPKPAVGTLQRNTLIPVPDLLFYKDQLEEINEITGRIAALTEAVKVRLFVPGGAASITDAIENAINSTSNNAIIIPISNWAAMGTGSPRDMVIEWPIDKIAATIEGLITLRKQLIDDVYQITGLSDIMRGSTVASETLGAQQLKSQYGSVRIRDKQNEMTRIARDAIRIAGEIIAENYSADLVNRLCQMELPTDADIKGNIKKIEAEAVQIQAMVAKAKSNPAIMAQAQANPEAAQGAIAQAQQQLQSIQQQIEKLTQTVTIDQVMKFLRDNRMRSFTLDIETDSTIQPDEDAAKQRATEYITAMGGLLNQAIPAVEQVPQTAPVMAEIINFANSQYRVGRQMATVVEEFTDQMSEIASQPKPDPNAAKNQLEQARQAHDQQMAANQQQHDLESDQRKQAYDQAEEARKAEWDRQQAQNKHDEAMLTMQFEMKKLDVEAEKSEDQKELELTKARLAAVTSIMVANINAKAKTDAIQISGEIDTALSQMEANQPEDADPEKTGAPAVPDKHQQMMETMMQGMQAIADKFGEGMNGMVQHLAKPKTTKLITDPVTGRAIGSQTV